MCQSAFLLLLGLSLGLVNAFPTAEPDNGKHWVVIVAGSNGWYNYRHQVSGAKQGNYHETGVTMSPYQVQTVHDSVVYCYNPHWFQIRHFPFTVYALPEFSQPRKFVKFVADLLLVALSVSQADACHAYQIVHKNGIPDEQIVVMMYDDLAQNEE